MDISKITDIKELKLLKADSYDMLEKAKANARQARQNIELLNQRIVVLEAIDQAVGKDGQNG